jgi:hypothetical protein
LPIPLCSTGAARVFHDDRSIPGTNERERLGTPGIGGRLPTYRLTMRNSLLIASWFVVIE